ncbi:MAG: DUF4349 domain-containing protein [Saprospiraceae bacterium]
MKPITKLLPILLLTFIFGCSQSTKNSGFEMAEARTMASEADMDQQAGEGEVEIERKLIKEGWVEFETTGIDATRSTIMAALEQYKGYVASDQANRYTGRISNTLTVRIPAENFDAFLSAATEGITQFDSKNINVRDVTEEFVDITARLKTKKELETRYLSLLANARNVSEMLEVEKQLGQLRADIESIEGRLKYLENKVSLATLNLTFYQRIPGETNFTGKFSEGFRNGWNNLIWFFVGLVNIWPFVVILLVLGYLFWRWRNKNNG